MTAVLLTLPTRNRRGDRSPAHRRPPGIRIVAAVALTHPTRNRRGGRSPAHHHPLEIRAATAVPLTPPTRSRRHHRPHLPTTRTDAEPAPRQPTPEAAT
jgi:hypothetical protein